MISDGQFKMTWIKWILERVVSKPDFQFACHYCILTATIMTPGMSLITLIKECSRTLIKKKTTYAISTVQLKTEIRCIVGKSLTKISGHLFKCMLY